MSAVALLLWMRRNWRLAVSGAMALLVIAAWAYVTHLRHVAQAQKAQLAQARAQAVVQVAVTKAVDAVAVKTQAVEEHTHVIVKTIHDAPGADAPVPVDVLSAWRAGLLDPAADPPR